MGARMWIRSTPRQANFSGNGKLAAEEGNANRSWRQRAESSFEAAPPLSPLRLSMQAQELSSAIAVDGSTGYIRVGSELSAVDLTKTNGHNDLWSFAGDGQLAGSALVVADTVYIGSLSGALYALDRESGSVVWQGSAAGPIGTRTRDSLATGEGLLIAGSEHTLTAWRHEGTSGPNPREPVPLPRVRLATMAPASGAVAYQLNPRHNGVATGTGVRIPLRTAWRRSLGGVVTYPLVVKDRVVTTVRDPDDGHWYLYGLKRQSGHLAWPRIDLGQVSGFAQPAYDDGKLFVLSGNGRMRAVSARTGNVEWSRRLPRVFANFYEAWVWYGAPVAADGTVYVTGAGRGIIAYAVNEANGHVRWMQGLNGGDEGAPAVSDSAVYFVGPCTTQKLDRRSGKILWTHSRGCTGGGGSSPVLNDGKLYVDDGVNAILDAASGEALRGFNARTPPALSGSRAFVVIDGVLRAEDRATGMVAWAFEGDGHLLSAPLVLDGVVYVTSEAGAVYGVRQGSGQLVWQGDAGGSVRPPTGPLVGMSAGHGTLVVPTETSLAAFSSE